MTIVVPVLIISCQVSEYWKNRAGYSPDQDDDAGEGEGEWAAHCRDVHCAAVLKQALNENVRSFWLAPADFVNKLLLDEW